MSARPLSPRAIAAVAYAAASTGMALVFAVTGWARLAALFGAVALVLTIAVLAHLVRLQEPRR